MRSKNFKCDVCDKRFIRAKTVEVHKRIHTGEKPFKCTHCEKTFSQVGNLNVHINFIHKGLENEVRSIRHHCSICSKKAISPVDLKTHMRVHTGDQPFQCEHCHRYFSQKGNLNIHIRRFHTDAFAKRLNGSPRTRRASKKPYSHSKGVTHLGTYGNPSPNYIYTEFNIKDFAPPKESDQSSSYISTSIHNINFASEKLHYIPQFNDKQDKTASFTLPVTVSGVKCNPSKTDYGGIDCDFAIGYNNGVEADNHVECDNSVNENLSGNQELIDDQVYPSICQETSIITDMTPVAKPIKSLLSIPDCSINEINKSKLPIKLEETWHIVNSDSAVNMTGTKSTNISHFTTRNESAMVTKEKRPINDGNLSDSRVNGSIKDDFVILNDEIEIDRKINGYKGGIVVNLSTHLHTKHGPFHSSTMDYNKFIKSAGSSLINKEVTVVSDLSSPLETVSSSEDNLRGDMFFIDTNYNLHTATSKLNDFQHFDDNIYTINNAVVDRKNTNCKEINVLSGVKVSHHITENYSVRKDTSGDKITGDSLVFKENKVNEVIDNSSEKEVKQATKNTDSLICYGTHTITGIAALEPHNCSESYSSDTGLNTKLNHYSRKSANVIVSSSSIPISSSLSVLGLSENFSNEVHVISSVNSSFKTKDTSHKRDSLSNEYVKMECFPQVCCETNVITSVASSKKEDNITDVDMLMKEGNRCDRDYLVLNYTCDEIEGNSSTCQVTNVITEITSSLGFMRSSLKMDFVNRQQEMTHNNDFSTANSLCNFKSFEKQPTEKILNDNATSPFFCQTTNVITEISLPLEGTITSLNDTSISENKLNDMPTSDSRTVKNSFEICTSFENTEEELAPYESIQNTPIYLDTEYSKDIESLNALYQNVFPSSIATTSAKTPVIVNNDLFQESFLISTDFFADHSSQMQTRSLPDDCASLDDGEIDFTDMIWHNADHMLPLVNRLSNMPVSSLSTVIKNVSGGEIKDTDP